MSCSKANMRRNDVVLHNAYLLLLQVISKHSINFIGTNYSVQDLNHDLCYCHSLKYYDQYLFAGKNSQKSSE